MPLTSRERLTRLFEGRDIDRVPIWLLAPFHRLGCYADIYRNPSYKPLLPYIDRCCDTFDRRGYPAGFCYNGNPEIVTREFTERQGENVYHRRIVTWRDISFERYQGKENGRTVVKYFVEDPEELERILEIPYVPPVPDTGQYQREKAELGDRGLMMVDIGDPLAPLYHLMSAQDFSMATLTDYEVMLSFCDAMMERVLEYYRTFLERDIGEVFFLVGSEFAGPPLVHPAKFQELSVRYVKRIVDLIRSYGKWSVTHYHGQLYDVRQGMKEIGADGLHTVEAPPIGNCTISQAREVLGDMILIGNIQYDDLTRLSREEIIAMTRSVVEEGKAGRFILSPTAGPYEESITPKTVENYIAMIETGVQYGTL